MLVLGDSPGPDIPPKPAVLSRLLRAGLPVPPGLACAAEELTGSAVRERLADLLAGGPVIVRAALASEDTVDAAAAGLGLSVPDCRDLADVDRAAAAIAEAAGDPWLRRYSGGAPTCRCSSSVRSSAAGSQSLPPIAAAPACSSCTTPAAPTPSPPAPARAGPARSRSPSPPWPPPSQASSTMSLRSCPKCQLST
ncbi:hypothetical protein OV079_38545 [Nannocystis pusilla]|uniref:Uncharacterized protein n=1 Tax=Nannocystis pusilla TaxID=889268 RepID=A0A9X3EWA2_9BACT|nr:hypothetical protein [Nannocystis pusilla]MCY1011362.1 hypothetical protein [Nannocystis pusilla]